MDFWSTLNTHFGHLGTAEIKKCRNHTSEIRIWHYNTSFYHFLLFLWSFKFQRRISAQIILQTKSFRCVKSFKMTSCFQFCRIRKPTRGPLKEIVGRSRGLQGNSKNISKILKNSSKSGFSNIFGYAGPRRTFRKTCLHVCLSRQFWKWHFTVLFVEKCQQFWKWLHLFSFAGLGNPHGALWKPSSAARAASKETRKHQFPGKLVQNHAFGIH